MAVITNSVVIRCTPDDAFDYLSDARNELEWNPAVQSMEKITDGPVGLGTKYRAKWKSSSWVEVETVTFDRPHTWAWHNGGPVEVTVTVRLTPVPEGTKLDSTFDATPHRLFRLVFPIFLRKLRKEEAANMQHLKAALERRARKPEG